MIKKIYSIFILVLIFAVPTVYGQEKRAQAGMKFLQVSTDARTSAMGDAATALEGNSSSIFANPASMARMQGDVDINVGQFTYIADIKYLYGTAAYAPFGGKYGVVGASFTYVDYGDFLGTMRASNALGYFDLGIFSPKAYYFGISYANALNDKFSIGGTVKYCVQDLGSSITDVNYNGGNTSYSETKYKPGTLAFDFGLLYHTGIKSLDFGATVRNFSKEVKLEEEGYQLPLLFKIGLAFNLSDLINLDKNEHSLQLAVDAVHNRDYDEQINLGLEYKFMNMVSLRVGNSSPNDEHSFTAGFGIEKKLGNLLLGVDYAYTPWTVFDDVHKFTVHFNL
jgi:hypothetical protein